MAEGLQRELRDSRKAPGPLLQFDRFGPHSICKERDLMPEFQRRQKTLLCIDDYQNALAGWCLYLQGAGYCVAGASSAQDGLEIFATRQVDIVVLDYAMPEVTGDIVAATMKKMKPSVPIIMFTGVPDVGEQARDQIDVLVAKGCDPSVLLQIIDEVLQIRACAAS
jgi:CheY-like chemotaxis protein